MSAMPCCRSVLLMMLVLCAGSATATPREPVGAVTIRIHDYSIIERHQLRQAERQVADTYARIGVALDWRPLVRPTELGTSGAWPTDLTDITIVVLTREMAQRLALSADVAGYAPITREHGGRIAFVLGDRTREIAIHGRVDQASVLAGVIAHELAHLLMPERSHSRDGVMRPHWNPAEFRNVGRRQFSDAEAASIRQMVRGLRGNQLRVAD
jgi:hypothetical protein